MSTQTAPAKFRLRCPKCSGLNVSIERLGASSYQAEEWYDRVLICVSCGKRLYGAAIKAEFDGQVKAHKREQRALKSAAKKAEEEARLRAEEEARRRAEAEALEREQEAQERRLRIRLVEEGECAWKECSNTARPRSIYCSRTCSNRNARWRHKQRQ